MQTLSGTGACRVIAEFYTKFLGEHFADGKVRSGPATPHRVYVDRRGQPVASLINPPPMHRSRHLHKLPVGAGAHVLAEALVGQPRQDLRDSWHGCRRPPVCASPSLPPRSSPPGAQRSVRTVHAAAVTGASMPRLDVRYALTATGMPIRSASTSKGCSRTLPMLPTALPCSFMRARTTRQASTPLRSR